MKVPPEYRNKTIIHFNEEKRKFFLKRYLKNESDSRFFNPVTNEWDKELTMQCYMFENDVNMIIEKNNIDVVKT